MLGLCVGMLVATIIIAALDTWRRRKAETMNIPKQDPKLAWYNYRTNDYDYFAGLPTDEDAKQYIPQHPSAIELYECYRETWHPPNESLVLTLSACVGKPMTEAELKAMFEHKRRKGA